MTLQAWARGRATRVAFQQIIANLVRLQRSYGFRLARKRLVAFRQERVLDLSISVARMGVAAADRVLDLSMSVREA